MDLQKIKEQMDKVRLEWHYLLTGFFMFILLAILLYVQSSRNYAFGIAIFVFLLYFLLLWLESFFRKDSQAKKFLAVGSLNAFISLVLLIGAAFLNSFGFWEYKPYYVVAVIANFFLAVSLQKASHLFFNYVEHKLDSNSFVRTPENLKKIQMFWRFLIVILFTIVIMVSYLFVAERSSLYVFFIVISFFTNFIMFRFIMFMDDSKLKRHLNGTSNACIISAILFIFTWILDATHIPILPLITLFSATLFFSISLQKITFIGWFIR